MGVCVSVCILIVWPDEFTAAVEIQGSTRRPRPGPRPAFKPNSGATRGSYVALRILSVARETRRGPDPRHHPHVAADVGDQ